MRIAVGLMMGLSLTGCDGGKRAVDPAPVEALPANTAESAPPTTTNAGETSATVNHTESEVVTADGRFIGRWNGPEGLFLHIEAGEGGTYRVTNRDTLDRTRTYEGRLKDHTLRFMRDGVEQTVQPGTGKETGFKYLADKTHCLIVRTGVEGYCAG